MAIIKTGARRWVTNTSAVRHTFKKPEPGPWDGYFYTGPTLAFGHNPPKKGSRKG